MRWWAASWTSTTWQASSTCCWWPWASVCWSLLGNTCSTGNYVTLSTSLTNLTSCWPLAGWDLLVDQSFDGLVILSESWAACCLCILGCLDCWLLGLWKLGWEIASLIFTLIIWLNDWLAGCNWISWVTAWLSDWKIDCWIILTKWLVGCFFPFNMLFYMKWVLCNDKSEQMDICI